MGSLPHIVCLPHMVSPPYGVSPPYSVSSPYEFLPHLWVFPYIGYGRTTTCIFDFLAFICVRIRLVFQFSLEIYFFRINVIEFKLISPAFIKVYCGCISCIHTCSLHFISCVFKKGATSRHFRSTSTAKVFRVADFIELF
jgi:hypothetical protein